MSELGVVKRESNWGDWDLGSGREYINVEAVVANKEE